MTSVKDADYIARLENEVVMLRNAVVVAYVMVDSSDDASGAALGALSIFRHVLDETGGFQRAMGREADVQP